MMKENQGTVSRYPDGFAVSFERVLAFPAQQVWEAITQTTHLAQWFTDIEMELKVGSKIIIRFRDADKTETFGEIVKIEPPRIFQWTWEGELATWEIIPLSKTSCRLIFTHSKISDRYAISVPAGWHILLDQLEAVLSGIPGPFPFDGVETEQTRSLKEKYRSIIQKTFPEII